jgi:Tc5 transposase DNA-binding domain
MPSRPPHSPEVCRLIQEACNTLKAQEKPNITQVLREIKNRTGHVLPYDTVRRRFLQTSLPPSEAHAHQQLLSPAVEKVLVDWIIFLSDTSHPLSKRSIRRKAEALCGRKPGESWIRGFLERHQRLSLEDHLALIPNVLRPSTGPSLADTSISFFKSSKNTKSLPRTYTTWMRRGVREVVGAMGQVKSILYLADDGQSIDHVVQI